MPCDMRRGIYLDNLDASHFAAVLQYSQFHVTPYLELLHITARIAQSHNTGTSPFRLKNSILVHLTSIVAHRNFARLAYTLLSTQSVAGSIFKLPA